MNQKLNTALNSKIVQEFEGRSFVPKSSITEEVVLEPSSLVSSLGQILQNELYRTAGDAGTHLVGGISEDDVRKYITTVIWMRVNHVRGVRNKTVDSYNVAKRKTAVPVLVYQLLIGIGEAIDFDYGIKFVPAFNVAGEDLLSADELRRISDIMFLLQNKGFKVVAGINMDISGELGFMAMSHVDSVVTSYRKDHPVYGFLAAFFRQEQLNSITGTMNRVVYGYESDYEYNIAKLVSVIGGSD